MRFLTEEQFERQNFIYYIRTGKWHYYSDYLKYKEIMMMEYKSLFFPDKKENETFKDYIRRKLIESLKNLKKTYLKKRKSSLKRKKI